MFTKFSDWPLNVYSMMKKEKKIISFKYLQLSGPIESVVSSRLQTAEKALHLQVNLHRKSSPTSDMRLKKRSQAYDGSGIQIVHASNWWWCHGVGAASVFSVENR